MVAFVYFLVTHSYLCWSSDLIKPQCFLLDPSVLLGSPLFRLVHSSTNLQQPSQTFILVTSNLHHISNFAGSKPYLVGGLEHQFYFPIYIYWECHHPSWRSYFSEGWPNHQPAIHLLLKTHGFRSIFFCIPCAVGPCCGGATALRPPGLGRCGLRGATRGRGQGTAEIGWLTGHDLMICIDMWVSINIWWIYG